MSYFNRRTFLKGLGLGAGAFVLSPMLRQLKAHAEGVQGPTRLVLMVEGDCLKTSRFTPPEVLAALQEMREQQGLRGDAEARSSHYTNETPMEVLGPTLQSGFAPLQPYADNLVTVQGLSNAVAGRGGGSHSGGYGALSCSTASRSMPTAPTIDTVLGNRLGEERVFPRLALGSVEFRTRSDGTPIPQDLVYAISADGAGAPSPIYVNPISTHQMLFGLVSGSEARERFELQANLLDKMREDVERARNRLAGAEREKLDAYLGSLETLDDRQSKIITMEEALERNMPEITNTYTSPHMLVRLEAQAELATAALTSGLTDIVLLDSAAGSSYFSARYTSLDDEIPAKHHFGHGGSFKDQNKTQWLNEIHRRHSVILANLIERLKAVPEGDGTMWDNTIVVYTSDGGETHHASFSDWPTLVLAGDNTAIKTTPGGRSLVYPRQGSDNHRQMSNFWNTLGHAMGAPLNDFGREGGMRVADGPLSELLA
jgi:hypothetical protein